MRVSLSEERPCDPSCYAIDGRRFRRLDHPSTGHPHRFPEPHARILFPVSSYVLRCVLSALRDSILIFLSSQYNRGELERTILFSVLKKKSIFLFRIITL